MRKSSKSGGGGENSSQGRRYLIWNSIFPAGDQIESENLVEKKDESWFDLRHIIRRHQEELDASVGE